jgi:hypothetical protein
MQTCSDWDVYRFGLWVGTRSAFAAPRHALASRPARRDTHPVRGVPVCPRAPGRHRTPLCPRTSAAQASVVVPGRTRRCRVWATDLVDEFFAGVPHGNCSRPRQSDTRWKRRTRRRSHTPTTFDRVLGAVLEHIPGDGDASRWRNRGYSSREESSASPCRGRPRVSRSLVPGPGAYWLKSSVKTPAVLSARLRPRLSAETTLLGDRRLDVIDVRFWGDVGSPSSMCS